MNTRKIDDVIGSCSRFVYLSHLTLKMIIIFYGCFYAFGDLNRNVARSKWLSFNNNYANNYVNINYPAISRKLPSDPWLDEG